MATRQLILFLINVTFLLLKFVFHVVKFTASGLHYPALLIN